MPSRCIFIARNRFSTLSEKWKKRQRHENYDLRTTVVLKQKPRERFFLVFLMLEKNSGRSEPHRCRQSGVSLAWNGNQCWKNQRTLYIVVRCFLWLHRNFLRLSQLKVSPKTCWLLANMQNSDKLNMQKFRQLDIFYENDKKTAGCHFDSMRARWSEELLAVLKHWTDAPIVSRGQIPIVAFLRSFWVEPSGSFQEDLEK